MGRDRPAVPGSGDVGDACDACGDGTVGAPLGSVDAGSVFSSGDDFGSGDDFDSGDDFGSGDELCERRRWVRS